MGGTQFERRWDIKDSMEEIDTMVIGYPYETPFETNHHFFKQIIDFLADNGLNAFCLSEEIAADIRMAKKKSQIESGRVYAPRVSPGDADLISSLRDIGSTNKPVFAVVGTNVRQGKFTLQLRIKQALEREGYKIGWLSTEPQGELFGANFSFPYGFDGSANLEMDRWPETISCAIKGIDLAVNPDIIIAGHQSGLLPYIQTNFLRNKLNHLMFLAGVQPDAVACVVSPEDDLNAVRDVIGVARHLFRIPTLFLALASHRRTATRLRNGSSYIRVDRLSQENWENCASRLERELGLPVINAQAENSAPTIITCIETFFAKKD